MKGTWILWIGCLLSAWPALGCGGGGGGGGGGGAADTPVSALAGSWFGIQEPDSGLPQTFAFDLDAAGNLTNLTVDGVLQPDTATLTNVRPYVFTFTTSGGGNGLLWVDPSLTRAGFVDDEDTGGVLERGATALPVVGYADADLRSVHCAGLTLEATAALGLDGVGAGVIDVSAAGTFSGNLGAVNFGNEAGKTLDCVRPVHGVFFSDSWRTGFGPSYIRVFLGPSKDYVAGWIVEHGGALPQDAVFFGWTRG